MLLSKHSAFSLPSEAVNLRGTGLAEQCSGGAEGPVLLSSLHVCRLEALGSCFREGGGHLRVTICATFLKPSHPPELALRERMNVAWQKMCQLQC